MCYKLSNTERSVFTPPDGKGKTATGVFPCLSTSSVASYSSTVLRQSSTVEDKLEVVTEDTFHETLSQGSATTSTTQYA